MLRASDRGRQVDHASPHASIPGSEVFERYGALYPKPLSPKPLNPPMPRNLRSVLDSWILMTSLTSRINVVITHIGGLIPPTYDHP